MSAKTDTALLNHPVVLTRLKFCADVSLGKTVQGTQKSDDEKLVNYIRAASIQPYGLELDDQRMWMTDAELDKLDLRTGDILIVEGGAGYGRSVVLDQDMPGWGFQNSIVRARPSSDWSGRFLRYVVLWHVYSGQVAVLAGGATIPHFTGEKVRELLVPDLPLATQRAIADYLDRETGEIGAMIGKLDDLVELLESRRLSVIQRKTQLTTSGERWETVPTAYLFGSIGSGTTPKEREHYTDDESGVPWVTTSELRESEIYDTGQRVTPKAVETVSSLKIHPRGAIVIAMYGATIGRLGTLGVDATMNQACCAFSDPRGADARFFYYSLWGQRNDIVRQAVGGGQPNISQKILRRWRVPRPPLDEQGRIADHLDEVTGRIDAMLAKVAKLKELLTERHAALITEVVTGKKEVV